MARVPFKKRLMEWWFAISTIGFGVWLALPMVSMSTGAFYDLTRILSENQWATLFFLTGLAHAIALYVNGSRWWTPFARTGMLTVNTFSYALFACGFAMTYWPTTATYTYGCMILSAAFICIYRAVKDCVHAWEVRRIGT